ncbi:hypothetical protein BE04_25980 [Sorangium cellulosum]|uniref:PD-(D/E)XK endonuclease-like domain-containing protein n=1 Tax=Sorangium cellulosum TaxID=56 RepID=A0A150PXP1_SORCE|nr:hypothetical protein BE04_25980 [Sorangium cellulosum]
MTYPDNQRLPWRVVTPAAWPSAPADMSVTTYNEIDECPRRWALGAADYPGVWGGRGYPPRLQVPALTGSVVHLALEIITKQLARAGCPSPNDPSATQVMKDLGGYTSVINKCIDRVLERFADNPRALPVLEYARRTLRGQVPALRTRAQAILARLRLPAIGRAHSPNLSQPSQTARRAPLSAGAFPEIELRARRIGWKGKADLLVVSDDACEITDFKTGSPDEAHRFQVRVYALLWALDEELNPSGRAVRRLALAYEAGDVEVEPPTAQELDALTEDLVERRTAAEASLSARPPAARPTAENCRYCGVRQLCDDYWSALPRTRDEDPAARFGDVELKIVRRHGPTSWDAIVERARSVPTGTPALVRLQHLVELTAGEHLRVLEGAIVLGPAEDGARVIVTLGAFSEMYALT